MSQKWQHWCCRCIYSPTTRGLYVSVCYSTMLVRACKVTTHPRRGMGVCWCIILIGRMTHWRMPWYILPTWSAVMGELKNWGWGAGADACMRLFLWCGPAIWIHALMRNSTGLVGCCQKIATSSGYLCILFHFVHMIAPLATHLICQAWQSVPTNCSKALIGGCLNRHSFYKSVGILHQTRWFFCFRMSQKLSEAGS